MTIKKFVLVYNATLKYLRSDFMWKCLKDQLNLFCNKIWTGPNLVTVNQRSIRFHQICHQKCFIKYVIADDLWVHTILMNPLKSPQICDFIILAYDTTIIMWTM